jgi:hypothetical protein
MPVEHLGSNLITKVEMTGSRAFDVDITHGKYSDIANTASKNPLDQVMEWIDLVIQVGDLIKNMILGAMAWFRFLFIDNGIMVLALYILGTLAFASRRGQGKPDRILRIWFRDQKALIEFMLRIPEWIVNVINLIRRTIL